MEELRMGNERWRRWCALMVDVRLAATARHAPAGSRVSTLSGLSVSMKHGTHLGEHGFALGAPVRPLDDVKLTEAEGPLYTVVRLGRIFRGALQVDANGAGKDITAAIRLIERAEEDGRITASQRAELFEIMGVPS